VLDRTPDHQLVENPDQPLKGMPVMLRVPSHLDVTVSQIHTWVKQGVERPTHVEGGRPQFDVDCKLIEIEKMFVVDPLRPLSGDQEYGFGFYQPSAEYPAVHQGQLKSMAYKSVDTSIKDVAALAGAVIQRARLASTDSGGNTGLNPTEDSPVFTTSHVVAFRRFDINEPDFEESLRAFLSETVNSRSHSHETVGRARWEGNLPASVNVPPAPGANGNEIGHSAPQDGGGFLPPPAAGRE
jgi:hypothetical protein